MTALVEGPSKDTPLVCGCGGGVFSSDGAYLRQNRPSLVRLTPATAPEWVRDIVAVAEDQRWPVLHVGHNNSALHPRWEGLRGSPRARAAPDQRRRPGQFLRRLQSAGFPTLTATRDQARPGGGLRYVVAAAERSDIPAAGDLDRIPKPPL